MYTYHRLTPTCPGNAEGLSWRFPRFLRRPARNHRRGSQQAGPRPENTATARRSEYRTPNSAFALPIPHSANPHFVSLPAFLASLETGPPISGQIGVKSAQNRAPVAPNTSVHAHNSIEFVPPCSSKTLENTARRSTPAKLFRRLSFRFPRFLSRNKTNSQSRVATWPVAEGAPATNTQAGPRPENTVVCQ
jgi:hypothetical protein